MENVEMLYLPVPDLEAALAFYRDTLGWPEAWREGDTTASLVMPGENLQVMLDQSAGPFRAGPIIVVDDVRAWCTSRRDKVKIWLEPEQIPGGYWAAFEDVFGNPIYVLDQSEANDE